MRERALEVSRDLLRRPALAQLQLDLGVQRRVRHELARAWSAREAQGAVVSAKGVVKIAAGGVRD